MTLKELIEKAKENRAKVQAAKANPEATAKLRALIERAKEQAAKKESNR